MTINLSIVNYIRAIIVGASLLNITKVVNPVTVKCITARHITISSFTTACSIRAVYLIKTVSTVIEVISSSRVKLRTTMCISKQPAKEYTSHLPSISKAVTSTCTYHIKATRATIRAARRFRLTAPYRIHHLRSIIIASYVTAARRITVLGHITVAYEPLDR